MFMKFMKELGSIIEAKFGHSYEQLYNMVKEDARYDTIRVAEPDIFDYKWQPIIQFSQPTAISRLRINKNHVRHCFERKGFSLLDMYFKPSPEDNVR